MRFVKIATSKAMPLKSAFLFSIHAEFRHVPGGAQRCFPEKLVILSFHIDAAEIEKAEIARRPRFDRGLDRKSRRNFHFLDRVYRFDKRAEQDIAFSDGALRNPGDGKPGECKQQREKFQFHSWRVL